MPLITGINNFGAPFADATGACINNLERKIIQALTSLYGNDIVKINEVLEHNNAVLKDGKIDCLNKSYTLVNISKNIQANLNSNVESLLNGKNIAEYESECKQAYNLAYGEENGTRLAEAFVESQVKGVQAVKAGVQGVGMLVTIAGQVIPIGGQIASAMIWGGIALGTFGGATVQFAEDVTKAGGITEDDKKAIVQEIATSAALMASGMGIGKISSMAYAELVMQNCPRLAALVSKVGLDASLSVLADYAITGQVNLTSEGISQLIPVLIGLTKARGSMNAYLNAEMPNKLHLQNKVENQMEQNVYLQDKQNIINVCGGKYTDFWNSNPDKLDLFVERLTNNKTPIQTLLQFGTEKWDAIINSLQKIPSYEIFNSLKLYKKDSSEINNALTNYKKNNIKPNIQTENDIKNITNFLSTQKIPEAITTYRDDNYIVLESIKISNSLSLAQKLKELSNTNSFIANIKVKKNLKQEKLSFIQERFCSTTLSVNTRFNPNAPIRWKLNLPKDTHGMFMETINTMSGLGEQMEFLLQRNSEFIIKSIKKKNNIWYIEADVKN